jgi:hypothetical protein
MSGQRTPWQYSSLARQHPLPAQQRSSGKRALVEFSLDAHAHGPGYFVVG